MDNLLYYPYINIPRTDWTIRTLLYYDQIGTIVPPIFNDRPELFEPFMKELIDDDLVVPINPQNVLDKPYEISKSFIEYINSPDFIARHNKKRFKKGKIIHSEGSIGTRIHSQKFDSELFYQLVHAGLALKENHNWFIVEEQTATDLMSFLASIIGEKLKFLPTTDIQVKRVPYMPASKEVYLTKRKENIRREIILKKLIPFPEQIVLSDLRKFKDNHRDLLKRFKNKIELIALNQNLDEDSDLFKETLKELEYQKEELSAKMNENKLGEIIFGTVCGVVGAIIGLASTGSSCGALTGSLSALPSFIHAIHTSLKIEQVENVRDQSGMKYLALIDKQLRQSVVR